MATAITTNDYIKGHDKNTKDIDTLTKRISDIVANNGNGTKDVEIVDARRGKASLRDRIDEVENKIALNNDEISKETKDARVDFDGGIHKNLNLRLLEDFNNLYKLIYNSTLLEYEGQYITANNSYKGITENMQLKGRTLQNLLKSVRTDILAQYGSIATWQSYKPGTVYTIKITNKSTETKKYYFNEHCFTASTEITLSPNQTSIVKITTLANLTQSESIIEILLKNKITHAQPNNLEIMVLEGDWTNKEVPFFEGIRSVGETGENLELVSCAKNLFKLKDIPDIKESVSFTKLDNGFNIKGLWYAGFKVPLTVSNKYYVKFNKKVILGTASKVLIYDFTQKSIITNIITESGVLTINGAYDKNNTYLIFYCGAGTGTEGEVEFTDIAFYEGATQIPYEEYKEHRQAIALTEPLKSLPNSICDIVDFKKVKLTRNIGKVTFKGDENIVLATTKVNTIIFAIDVAPALVYTDIYNIICDRFSTGINILDVDAEGIRIISNASRVYISVLKSKLTAQDVPGFKTWLKANPTTVYYQLATPIETPIDLIPPRTYEPITNIFTTGSLIEPVLKCKVSSNIPAKIQTLSMGNQALKMENTMLRNTVEENNLTGIENSVNQESKITMMELGVI